MGCAGSKGSSNTMNNPPSSPPEDIDEEIYEETQKRASFTQNNIVNDGRTEHNAKSQDMVIDGYSFQYACVSKRGNYPDQPNKPNQDSYCAIPYLTEKAGRCCIYVRICKHFLYCLKMTHRYYYRHPSNKSFLIRFLCRFRWTWGRGS